MHHASSLQQDSDLFTFVFLFGKSFTETERKKNKAHDQLYKIQYLYFPQVQEGSVFKEQ